MKKPNLTVSLVIIGLGAWLTVGMAGAERDERKRCETIIANPSQSPITPREAKDEWDCIQRLKH